MDADRPLKTLFGLRARELLALTGDRGARVLSTRVPELPSVTRRVDTVLKLRRGRDVYLRHLEFEARARPGLAWRLFEYATRLASHYRVPVLTTVMFLRPPAPSSLAHRESIGGRIVHERRFDVIRLWEMDPLEMIRLGPGSAALVGPMRATNLAVIARAGRRILRSAPEGQRSELASILLLLSGGRYTLKQLLSVMPREALMGSSLVKELRKMFHAEWRAEALAEGRTEGRMEGRAEGRTEGALEDARRFVMKLVRRHHPEVERSVVRDVDECRSVSRLHDWGIAATELSGEDLVALVKRPPRPGRTAKAVRRVVRPARRSRGASGG